MSQAGVINNQGAGSGPLNTLSAEGGAHVVPSGNNFNFSGSVAGGSIANGAVLFSTVSPGEMNAAVQVDGVTVQINGSNQLQAISAFMWNTTSVNVTNMTKGNGYFCVSPGGALTLGLPATSVLGDTISIANEGATSWQITQAVGQRVRMGSSITTSGAGGSLTSTANGDTVTLVCVVANTIWHVVSSMGNITVI